MYPSVALYGNKLRESGSAYSRCWRVRLFLNASAMCLAPSSPIPSFERLQKEMYCEGFLMWIKPVLCKGQLFPYTSTSAYANFSYCTRGFARWTHFTEVITFSGVMLTWLLSLVHQSSVHAIFLLIILTNTGNYLSRKWPLIWSSWCSVHIHTIN